MGCLGAPIRHRRPGEIDVAPADFHHAIALREALFRAIAGLINGAAPGNRDRHIINDAAAQAGPRVLLDARGAVHRTGDVNAVLGVLARDVLDLCRSTTIEIACGGATISDAPARS